MKLHLIRHGESTWNEQGLVQGTKDPELSPKGRKQAQLLAQRLHGHSFEAIYSSPLKRACQTAEPLSAAHDLPILLEKDLREIELGEWEGRSIEQIRVQDKEKVDKWYKTPLEVKIPGAETVIKFRDRVVKAFETILSKHSQGEIVVVSHGGVISVYIGSLLEMNLNKIWTVALKNGALTTIEFSNGWIAISLFNDTCHLDMVSDSLITW